MADNNVEQIVVPPLETAPPKGKEALRLSRVREAVYYLNLRIPAELSIRNFGTSDSLAICAWLMVSSDTGAQVLATKLAGDLGSELDLAEEERQKALDRKRRQIKESGSYELLRSLSGNDMSIKWTDKQPSPTPEHQKEGTDHQKREKAVTYLDEMIREAIGKANYGEATILGTILQVIASPHRNFYDLT